MDGTTQEPTMPSSDLSAPPPNTIGGTNPGTKPVTIVGTIVNVGQISPQSDNAEATPTVAQ